MAGKYTVADPEKLSGTLTDTLTLNGKTVACAMAGCHSVVIWFKDGTTLRVVQEQIVRQAQKFNVIGYSVEGP